MGVVPRQLLDRLLPTALRPLEVVGSDQCAPWAAATEPADEDAKNNPSATSESESGEAVERRSPRNPATNLAYVDWRED
jgi:hypothetical protein